MSVEDFEIPVSREEFDLFRSTFGVRGKSHTDEDYYDYTQCIKQINFGIEKDIGKEKILCKKVMVGENTDLTIIEKEKGFVKWIT
jgi:hypothetical protein